MNEKLILALLVANLIGLIVSTVRDAYTAKYNGDIHIRTINNMAAEIDHLRDRNKTLLMDYNILAGGIFANDGFAISAKGVLPLPKGWMDLFEKGKEDDKSSAH
jgi:hypothetical protein